MHRVPNGGGIERGGSRIVEGEKGEEEVGECDIHREKGECSWKMSCSDGSSVRLTVREKGV